MKPAAIALVLLSLAANSVVGETKVSIEQEVIEAVEFGDVELEVALECLRATGTRISRKINGDPEIILKFDYHFDPLKRRNRITLKLTDTTFLSALTAVTNQAGLSWVVTKESILIVDARPNHLEHKTGD